MKKNKLIYTILTILLSIVLSLIIFNYVNSKNNVIGKVITDEVIDNTEYIKISTAVNNMSPKSFIMNDKDKLRQFYDWIIDLKNKGIDKNKQELEPGTEYTIVAYDSANTPLITMAYSVTKKQLQINHKVYNLLESINDKMKALIGE